MLPKMCSSQYITHWVTDSRKDPPRYIAVMTLGELGQLHHPQIDSSLWMLFLRATWLLRSITHSNLSDSVKWFTDKSCKEFDKLPRAARSIYANCKVVPLRKNLLPLSTKMADFTPCDVEWELSTMRHDGGNLP